MYNPAEDPAFQKPFIDREEERERAGIRYDYVHGGFAGTNVKFAFCFPKKEKYEGRFYQFLSPFPGPDEEEASQSREGMEDHIAFALCHGAYFVETNMGASAAFGNLQDPTILYRSSAAAAEFSREVARRRYGDARRPYGYVYGGSGGGYKTCACIENTTAFDGAAPFVTACPVALPNIMTVAAHARRILRHKLDWIADAMEPGAEHDVESGLNEEEREAFAEATRMGIPPEAWIGMRNADDGGFAVIAPAVRATDTTYFTDFWTKEGYLGTAENSSAVRDRICLKTRVRRVFLPSGEAGEPNEAAVRNGVDTAWQKMIMYSGETKPFVETEALPERDLSYLFGLKLRFLSGAAAGGELSIEAIEDGRLYIGQGFGQGTLAELLEKVRPDDEAEIDNSDYIAIQTYHRHQVPEAEYTVWDQFRLADGTPRYPQREPLLCYGFAYQGAGAIQRGDIQGKVIMVNCLADGGACTWMSDWYRGKVREKYGEQTDAHFRLYCLEHCAHTDQEHTADPYHIPSYLGVLAQALLDLAAWVEKGVAPAATSAYRIEDGRAYVPQPAEETAQSKAHPEAVQDAQAAAERCAGERRGVQPVVYLTANGASCAHVRAGESVLLKVQIGIPEGGGSVSGIEWSVDGEPFVLGEGQTRAVYDEPGTHFAAVRVRTNRRRDDPYTEIQNIGRVRIMVE